jgi:hypothetical protein
MLLDNLKINHVVSCRGADEISGLMNQVPTYCFMNSVLKKIIEGLVGMIVLIIFLRLLLVPTYAFMHSGSEPLMILHMIPEIILSIFIASKVVRYIHRNL